MESEESGTCSDPLVSLNRLASVVIDRAGDENTVEEVLSENMSPLQHMSVEEKKTALRALGVIELRRGLRASEVAEGARKSMENALSEATQVWKELSVHGSLTRANVEEIAPNHFEQVVRILKVLGLAVGSMGKYGGIKKLDEAEREKSQIEDEAEQESDTREAESTREHAWYPFVEALMQTLVDHTAITGDQSRGGGEWGTPDVVGYYLTGGGSQFLPVRRVVSAEVKLKLSRSSIAQASAFRRFSHYVYIAVPQTRSEIDLDLCSECGCLGIGVLCLKQQNSSTLHVLSKALWQYCDDEEVEKLLSRLRDGNGQRLSELVRAESRQLVFQALAEENI